MDRTNNFPQTDTGGVYLTGSPNNEGAVIVKLTSLLLTATAIFFFIGILSAQNVIVQKRKNISPEDVLTIRELSDVKRIYIPGRAFHRLRLVFNHSLMFQLTGRAPTRSNEISGSSD